MNDKLVGLIDSLIFCLFWYLILAIAFKINLLMHVDILLLLVAVSLVVAWRGFRLNSSLKAGSISCWNYTLDGSKWGGFSLFTWIFLSGVSEVYAAGGRLDGAELFSLQFLSYLAFGGGIFGAIGVFLGGINAFPLYFFNKWLNATNKE